MDPETNDHKSFVAPVREPVTPYQQHETQLDVATVMPRPLSHRPCVVDGVLLMVFPGEPLARAAAMVGHSALLVFCVTTLLFFGSIVCFERAGVVTDPVFFFLENDWLFANGYLFTATGPLGTSIFFALLWAQRYLETHEDLDMERDWGMWSLWLLIAHLVLQFALLAIVVVLHRQVLKRADDKARKSCCSVCILCCPSCAMASALRGARRTEADGAPSRSELPAYPV